jgi:hypothetical protein
MFNLFNDTYILDGVRTPQVDYQGAFADANPIDLGIKAARAVLLRSRHRRGRRGLGHHRQHGARRL